MDVSLLLMEAVQWPFMQSIAHLLDQGGAVLWLILLVAIIVIVLSAERLWFLSFSYVNTHNDMAALWRARNDTGNWCAHRIRQAMLARFKHQLRCNLSTIRVLVIICPLLGLLGTVTGMISVFDVMAFNGTGSARSMAAGISKATIPTMAGMVVAIMGLLLLARIDRLARSRLEALTEKLSVS